MVGIVLISHSQELAEALLAYTKMMAPNACVAAAGGLPDGSFGTSFEKISQAVCDADQGEGVLLLMDMGSAVMTAEMVVESTDIPNVAMVDCPFVEGAVEGTVLAQNGASMSELREALGRISSVAKF